MIISDSVPVSALSRRYLKVLVPDVAEMTTCPPFLSSMVLPEISTDEPSDNVWVSEPPRVTVTVLLDTDRDAPVYRLVTSTRF